MTNSGTYKCRFQVRHCEEGRTEETSEISIQRDVTGGKHLGVNIDCKDRKILGLYSGLFLHAQNGNEEEPV